MGMPGGLLEFTSPIVNKALETGARGSTTTETNYGVIGDAFFKKAQNDLGIAKLQSDIASDAAHLKVDTAMNTANLNLNKANILLDTSLRTQQLIQQQKQWEAENTVSGSEMFFGSLTGALQGGVTGYMMGGPPGAMAGAALGGVSTYGAYQEGGRHGGQAAQQFLGTAAQLSVAVKGYNEEKTAKDGWKTWVDAGTKILGVLNNASAAPEERLAAAQEWSGHLSEGAKVMSSMGMNPQQISTAIQGYDKAMRTGGASVIGADGKAMGGMEQMQTAFKYAADPDFSPTAPPEKQRAKAKQFYAEAAENHARQYGGKLIPTELVAAQAENIKPGMGDIVAGVMTGKLRNAPSGRIVTSMDHTDPNTLAQYQQGKITDPQIGNPITPTPPSYSVQNQIAPGVPFRQPTVSGGVEMDDGGTIDEIDLQKQGAATVQALGLDKGGSEQGNINLDNRPVLHNEDGTVSTEKSITIEEDGKFINIPTIINGKEVSPETAIAFYHDTGEHLGKFSSEQEAEQAAQETHQYQEKRTMGDQEPPGTPKKGMVEKLYDKALDHEGNLIGDDTIRGWRDRLKQGRIEEGEGKQHVTPYQGEPIQLKNKQFNQENQNIDTTLSQHLPVLDRGDAKDQKQAGNASSATKSIDEMIHLVETGQVPSGSSSKALGAKIREDGVGGPVGGAVGAVAGGVGGFAIGGPGAAAAGGAAGAAYGYKAGEGMDLAKGTGLFLSPKEQEGLDRLNAIRQNAIMNIAKAQDPGGRVAKDDYDNLAKKFYDPARSKAANIASLLQLKQEVANSIKATAIRILRTPPKPTSSPKRKKNGINTIWSP